MTRCPSAAPFPPGPLMPESRQPAAAAHSAMLLPKRLPRFGHSTGLYNRRVSGRSDLSTLFGPMQRERIMNRLLEVDESPPAMPDTSRNSNFGSSHETVPTGPPEIGTRQGRNPYSNWQSRQWLWPGLQRNWNRSWLSRTPISIAFPTITPAVGFAVWTASLPNSGARSRGKHARLRDAQEETGTLRLGTKSANDWAQLNASGVRHCVPRQ